MKHIYDYRLKKRGGGTSIFVKKSIIFEAKHALKLDINVDLVNSCFIEIDRNCVNSSKNIILGCIYKAPHFSIKLFNEKLHDLLTVLDKENKDVYLLGDFNINFDDRCVSNLHVQEFKNILNVHSYFNLITKPTKIRGHYATILDNVFTNASVDKIACANIFPTHAYSDHFPIFSVLNNVASQNNKKYYAKRNFSQKSIKKFNNSLLSVDWNQLFNYNDANSLDFKK